MTIDSISQSPLHTSLQTRVVDERKANEGKSGREPGVRLRRLKAARVEASSCRFTSCSLAVVAIEGRSGAKEEWHGIAGTPFWGKCSHGLRRILNLAATVTATVAEAKKTSPRGKGRLDNQF